QGGVVGCGDVDRVARRARRAGAHEDRVDARLVGQEVLRRGGVGDPDYIEDLPAVLEEALDRVPKVETRHRLGAEGLLELVPAGNERGLLEGPGRRRTEHRNDARCRALDGWSGGELLDVDPWIRDGYGHANIPPMPRSPSGRARSARELV